jgi:hypothetical protein
MGGLIVNAETTCTDKEMAALNKSAGLVKINYEIVEEKVQVPVMESGEQQGEGTTIKYSFKITIYNLTNDIYVVGTNSYDNSQISSSGNTSDDTKFTFVNDDMNKIMTYNFIVYSQLDDCNGIKLRTFTFIKPKYNYYYDYKLCQDNPDVSYCQKFITKDLNISESQLIDYIEKVKISTTTVTTTKTNSIIKFFQKYYLLMIIFLVAIILITISVIVIRKRRSRL